LERWFGLFLHVLVLFINMILIINLLIAIMSDTYARLSDLRVGLYWATVIKEMPKYRYHKTYGVLVMFPFVFSWIGFLCAPILFFSSNRRKLLRINYFANKFVFGVYSLLLLAVFMTVNLALLPPAYFKTLVHKVILYQKYKGSDQLQNVAIFGLMGIPFLVCSQVTDVFYFLRHTLKSSQQKQQSRNFELTITLADFQRFVTKIDGYVHGDGTGEPRKVMNAIELIEELRADLQVNSHSFHYFFGYFQVIEQTLAYEGGELDHTRPPPGKPLNRQRSIVDVTEMRREFNLKQIKTYNQMKSAIWNCVL